MRAAQAAVAARASSQVQRALAVRVDALKQKHRELLPKVGAKAEGDEGDEKGDDMYATYDPAKG